MTAKGQQELQVWEELDRNLIALLNFWLRSGENLLPRKRRWDRRRRLQRKILARARCWHGKLGFCPESLSLRRAGNQPGWVKHRILEVPQVARGLLELLCAQQSHREEKQKQAGRKKQKETELFHQPVIFFFQEFLTTGAVSSRGAIPDAACWGSDVLRRLLLRREAAETAALGILFGFKQPRIWRGRNVF